MHVINFRLCKFYYAIECSECANHEQYKILHLINRKKHCFFNVPPPPAIEHVIYAKKCFSIFSYLVLVRNFALFALKRDHFDKLGGESHPEAIMAIMY